MRLELPSPCPVTEVIYTLPFYKSLVHTRGTGHIAFLENVRRGRGLESAMNERRAHSGMCLASPPPLSPGDYVLNVFI
jgi:hypothetical protein